MELKLLHVWDGSGGNNCPSIYEADNGDLVVQGWKLDDETTASLQNLADNETAVRIPASVIAAVAARAGH